MTKNISTKATSKRNPITSIIGLILLLATVISILLFSVGCKKKAEFDYLSADLSQYIEFTGDYKNIKIEIDIAKPTDLDVEVSILNMLCSDKNKKPLNNGGNICNKEDAEITAGDVVKIWYRGYLVGDGDEQIVLEGMSNFASSSGASSLEIGSNSFIPGFELNLIGKKPADYSKFEKITTGSPTENNVVYITYTKTSGSDSSTKVTESNVRIDLSRDDIDETYGAGFKDKLLSLKVGDKVTFSDTEKDVKYTELTLNFFTACETNPIKVEAVFSYDYQKEELRNEKAVFEVYVESLVAYECPEFTNEYLAEKIKNEEVNVTFEELDSSEDDSLLTEKYRDFAMETMMDIYDDEYDTLVEEATWNRIVELAKVKKYPEDKVQKIYEKSIRDIEYQFKSSGGEVYNSSLGQYKTYETLDEYANVYVEVSNGQSWRDVIRGQAEEFVKERLVMFYILKENNLTPSESEFNKLYEETYREYVDEYIEQYLQYLGKTEEDYTEEEYNELVKDSEDTLNSNFDEEYFTTRTYFTVVADVMVEWPEVSTLDDRRAYPQDK